MNIWKHNSLSTPRSCKGARDYKLQCPMWRTRQRASCAIIDEGAPVEVALRTLRHGGGCT